MSRRISSSPTPLSSDASSSVAAYLRTTSCALTSSDYPASAFRCFPGHRGRIVWNTSDQVVDETAIAFVVEIGVEDLSGCAHREVRDFAAQLPKGGELLALNGPASLFQGLLGFLACLGNKVRTHPLGGFPRLRDDVAGFGFGPGERFLVFGQGGAGFVARLFRTLQSLADAPLALVEGFEQGRSTRIA